MMASGTRTFPWRWKRWRAGDSESCGTLPIHPEWMDVDLYIEPVRAMQTAGYKMNQVTATDTPELSDDVADKLNSAEIGWKLQMFVGRDGQGELQPRSPDEIRQGYPLLNNPRNYTDHYEN